MINQTFNQKIAIGKLNLVRIEHMVKAVLGIVRVLIIQHNLCTQ